MTDLVTCIKCNWVSFPVTKKKAQKEVTKFNKYYKILDEKGREGFGNKKASLKSYKCLCCDGGQFRIYNSEVDMDINGQTINPVIWEE